jgi:hypothetical protein
MRYTSLPLRLGLLLICLFLSSGCGRSQPLAPPVPKPTTVVVASPAPESTAVVIASPTSEATVVATASPTTLPATPEAARDFYLAETSLGIPVVDEIIAAMTMRDGDALRDLVRFESGPCTNEPGLAWMPRLGGSPPCESGMAEGTTVEIFPVDGLEESFVRPDGIEAVLPSAPYALYAAYQVSTRSGGNSYWPSGSYGLIFIQPETSDESGVTVLANAEGIVRLVYSTITDLLIHQEVGDFLLPPLDPDANGVGATFRITEVPLIVTVPESYALRKNSEYRRRGSFVSYDFRLSGEFSYPYLQEIQLFSEESIREFTENCTGFCFEGDFPDLERYHEQREALAAGQSYGEATLMTFDERSYLVSNHQCSGDACVIREYTTFVAGEIKVDFWVMMADASQTEQADEQFASLEIEEIEE